VPQNPQKSSNQVCRHVRNTTHTHNRRQRKLHKSKCCEPATLPRKFDRRVSLYTELQWLMPYWNKGESRTVKTMRTAAVPLHYLLTCNLSRCLATLQSRHLRSVVLLTSGQSEEEIVCVCSVHSYEVGLWKRKVIYIICIRYASESNMGYSGNLHRFLLGSPPVSYLTLKYFKTRFHINPALISAWFIVHNHGSNWLPHNLCEWNVIKTLTDQTNMNKNTHWHLLNTHFQEQFCIIILHVKSSSNVTQNWHSVHEKSIASTACNWGNETPLFFEIKVVYKTQHYLFVILSAAGTWSSKTL
jgi:hypothetical protein